MDERERLLACIFCMPPPAMWEAMKIEFDMVEEADERAKRRKVD